MPQVGLDPTIPVFERAKTVHALDTAATVIGKVKLSLCLITVCHVDIWETGDVAPPFLISALDGGD
jgi:hypothetical protein